ncbi:hypothetical protein D030_5370A, partial [Vibrio parahaemolyticus AQ3810]
MFSGAPTQK